MTIPSTYVATIYRARDNFFSVIRLFPSNTDAVGPTSILGGENHHFLA